MSRYTHHATRVAVLLGGDSSERAVSLKSGAMVVKHLPKGSYRVTVYDPGKKLSFQQFIADVHKGKIDVVFNALHGTHGEDGHIQGLFEILGLPYTGSGVASSALAMDKSLAKDRFMFTHIPTPKSVLVSQKQFVEDADATLAEIARKLGPKIVVKPNASGSSVGLSVKPKHQDWKRAISLALKEDGMYCLVEWCIEGRELTVPVLEKHGVPEALPVVEIRTVNGLFDYHAKYHDKRTQEICPAPISQSINRKAQSLAIKAHKSLGCKGYSRTDMLLDAKSKLWVLETNTLPGLTTASLLPKSAKVAGMDYPALLVRILEEARK